MVSVGDLSLGQHAWFPYGSAEERMCALAPYVREGLNRNERVLCLGDMEPRQHMLLGLGESGRHAVAQGQLVFEDSHRTYLQSGRFDGDRMIGHYTQATNSALGMGFKGMRIAADMQWAAPVQHIDELIAYEQQLDGVFERMPAMVVCEYDRRAFSACALARIESAHSLALPPGALYFSGVIDLVTRAAFRRALHAAANSGRDEVVIDLRNVTYIDAGAIGVISALAKERMPSIRVRVGPRLKRIFDLLKPTIAPELSVEEVG